MHRAPRMPAGCWRHEGSGHRPGPGRSALDSHLYTQFGWGRLLPAPTEWSMGRPKRRRLGQNFLVDRNVAEKIAALLAPAPERVLEIGPGRGALTAPLLARFERVLALEIDPGLPAGLAERFAGSGLEVRLGDALADDLDVLLAGEAPWQVASNLPYSVGTAILRRLLPRHDLVSRLVLMLQKEVAARVLATPGGGDHGLLALERAAYAEAWRAFDVSPHAFRPRPKVTSTVLVLELHPPSHGSHALEAGLRLAARALTRPRKTLMNAVRPMPSAAAIAAAGLDPGRRPGTLALDEWVTLASRSAAPPGTRL